MISLMPQWAFDALRKQIGAGFERLSQHAQIALATAMIEGDVTNTRMQDLVADHPTDITKLLRGLVAKELLVADNQRRWTRYRLPAQIATRPDLFTAAVENEGSRSPHTDADSSRNGPDSPRTGANSPRNDVDSPSTDPGSPLTEADLDVLRPLADPVSKQKRASQAKLKAVILALCRARFLTADQLANLCNREVSGLRDRTLSKMVAEGLLRFRHPGQPNRPDQAYTAADEAP